MNRRDMKGADNRVFGGIRLFLISAIAGIPSFLEAQIEHNHDTRKIPHSIKQSVIIENKGQWGDQVDGYAGLSGGSVYFQANKLHFDMYNGEELGTYSEKVHASKEETSGKEIQEMVFHKHYYQIELVGANPKANRSFSKVKEGVNHFFLGDRSTWRSNVKRYEELSYSNIYPGVDVVYKLAHSELKYDFVVDKHADVSAIQLQYLHTNNIYIDKGQLVIITSVGEQREYIPMAYQDIDGKRMIVPCSYHLQNSIVSFVFPQGYNPDFPLVIDPQLIGSTYSGSTVEVWGHTATYDEQGNIFVGGYGTAPGGVPVTPGAYQTTFGGGGDVAINKYNPDGTQLIFSTYLGGAGDEHPQSLITDVQGNLYVLGSTNSTNFPTTPGCIQNTSGGMTDIFVSRFSTDGATLIASTYIGGDDIDGENTIIDMVTEEPFDVYRSKMEFATNGDLLITSFSNSDNFPVTPGAFQTVHGGGQDGIVARINATLTTPVFVTYIGGTSLDRASAVINAPDGSIYVAGSVGTGIFTFPGTPMNAVFPGAILEGFVIRLSSNGQSLLNGTYVGSTLNGRSQALLVQLDSHSDVEIVVQSANLTPSTPGHYYGGAALYAILNDHVTSIMKYTSDLSTRAWVSTLDEMTPTAFSVGECDRIFFAAHSPIAMFGYYETTPDAIDTIDPFYIISLDAEATTLIYATCFGSMQSHCHGGTSRFDKNGVLYQGCCVPNDFFPLGPNGSYSGDNNGAGRDMVAFKFEVGSTAVEEEPFELQDQTFYACDGLPQEVNFEGSTETEVIHHWWFHDGSTSNIQDPTFNYTTYGDFTVDYYPEFTEGCSSSDTVQAMVHIIEAEPFDLDYSLIQGSCNDTLFIELDFTGTADLVAWNMGDGQSVNDQNPFDYFYITPGQYSITLFAEDTVCHRDETKTIPLDHKGFQGTGELFMPNVFTCNGDAVNDTYQISSIGYSSAEVFADLEYYWIKIVNRWGNTIFESNSTDQQTWKWDGKADGKIVDDGVYFYQVNYKTLCMHDVVEKTGYVHVIR